MKLYKILIITAITLFLLLVGIATVTIMIYVMAGKEEQAEQNLSTVLDSIDYDIAAGYFVTAAENLKEALKLCRTAREYLRLLKRVYQVDQYKANAAMLKEYSLAAWKKFPGNDDIAFLACTAALENENLVLAGDILKKAKKTEKFNRLRLQIELLKGEPGAAQVLKLGENISEGLRLFNSEDPELFKQIGMELRDAHLLLNAALFYMYQGEPQAAFQLMQQELFTEEFDPAAVFIAYDNNELATALFRINRLIANNPDNADYLALAGDFYFQNREYQEAKYSYLKAVNYNRKNSPTLFLNLNWIYQNDKNYEAAAVALVDGIDSFPGNLDLLFEQGKLLRKQSRYMEARDLITAFPGALNANLKLLLLSLNQKTMPPEQFIIKFWEIFNENADNGDICRNLVALLLKLDNIKDAETAMDIYAAASGIKTNAWLLHYRGIIAAVNKQPESAEQFLTESLALEDYDIIRYNLGVVQLAAGKYEAAGANFRQVLKLDKETLDRARPFYSRVVTRIGETLAGVGDIAGALKQFDYALEIFPQNYHTILLRKKLDTKNE